MVSKLFDRTVSDLPAILWTLGIGAVGGFLFDLWSMPLAWMIGSMCLTTVLALGGLPLKGSRRLRNIMIPILGVMLGSAFTPDAVDRAAAWFPTITGLLVFISVVLFSVGVFFYRIAGFGVITAYFAATPGGLASMTIIGADMGGDERTIALTHSIRILLTVLIIPFWFRLFEGYVPGGLSILGGIGDLSLPDGAVLIFCAVAGYAGGRFVRLPAAQILGPMILSAAVHLAGLTEAKPPTEVVNVAQLVIGAGIGARFAGIKLLRVFKVFVSAMASTVFMVGMAALFALGLGEITGIPFRTIWLAFAPGGLAEMALISLAMGIDPAFVSIHHLIRVFFMVLMAPLVFRYVKRRFGITGDARHRPPV